MRLIIIGLFALIILSACSAIPVSERSDQVDPDRWHAKGKFSYRSDSLSESGNFDWRQAGDEYQLRLYGPLGMGSVRISGNPHLVRIQNKDQDISSDQPLSLLYRITGFEIPLNSLPDWIRARPTTASSTHLVVNAENQPQSFEERGWQINFSDYQKIDGSDIPMELTATKDSVQLRLLVKTWEFE